MRHTSQCFGRFLRLKVCAFSVFVICLVLFVFSCFCGEGWGTIFPLLYKSMEPRRWRYYCWIPRCGFPIPDSGFQGLAFPDSFGVYSRFQSPRFWIPQAKNFPDPRTGFPSRARFWSYRLQETRFSWSSLLSP